MEADPARRRAGGESEDYARLRRQAQHSNPALVAESAPQGGLSQTRTRQREDHDGHL